MISPTNRRPRARGLALVAVLMLLLAACTGVPTSSAPEVVRTAPVGQQPAGDTITPAPGAEPRAIVSGFLAGNATDDQHHSAARSFLSPEAKNRWSDTTVTIVDDPRIGNFGADDTITVSGRQVGTIDTSGIYSPTLQGDGTGAGGVQVQLQFVLKRVDGQWRIDTLQNGLLISLAQFERYYQQRVVYFYDLPEQHLVPDLRYSSLQDSSLLATWLMTQLVLGERPSLQGAVRTELPTGSDPRRVTVTVDSQIHVEIPGSSQLDPPTRNRLAAQVALTLDQVLPGALMTITDGGRPIGVSGIAGDGFTASQFLDTLRPANNSPQLYYIRDGAVVDRSGTPLPGPVGAGQYGLKSVALATIGGRDDILVAGVARVGADDRLLVGSVAGGLKHTGVHGALSRPAWAPNRDEVWVGVGSAIYRVTDEGRAQVISVAASSGKLSGRVSALRLSPEGTRVAVVLTAADGTAQVWVGAVVRTSTSVRVGNLEPVSPQGVKITDVAWNDRLKLFAVGHQIATNEAGVYEMQCDGSLWTPRGTDNLPQAPDSITVAEFEVASVSAGPTVWVQRLGAWASPSGGTAYGTNPVYLE
jgi:hypothetical protein